MRITIIGGLAVVCVACAASPPTEERAGSAEQAIINGDTLDDAGEAMVKVQALAFDNANCSGFAVGPQLVMTAAHCLSSAWASLGVAGDLSEQDRFDYGPSLLRTMDVDKRFYEAEVVGATFNYDTALLFVYTADDNVYRMTQPNEDYWFGGYVLDEQDVTYPSGKTAADLLDVAYRGGKFYAYFVDGTISRGTSTDLSEVFGELNVHDRADGIDGPGDVMAVEFNLLNSDGVSLWYKNGRHGPVTDFGRGEPLRSLLPFETHQHMAPEDLRAVAVNPTIGIGNTYSIWRHPVPEDYTVTNAQNVRAAREIVQHPDFDASLIRIDESLPTPDDGFVTIPEEYTPADDVLDLLVTCHAYGNTHAEAYVFGSPRSMTAHITAVVGNDDEFLTAFPENGVSRLNSGDSGGECFVRGPDDEHELVGLVSGGSADEPLFARLTSAPRIRDWFLEATAEASSRTAFASLRDETLTSTTTTQLRLVFQNTTSAPLVSPKVYYYFTSEGGKTPVVDDYYTPNSSVSLEALGNNQHRLVYSMSGVTLQPGEIFPNSSGSVFALRYSDRSAWDKSNDYSQPSSSAFELSRKLVVQDGNGATVGGTPPELPEPPALECDDIAVYVRDSQFSEKNITTPRFYLKNNGGSALADFKVRYHFTVENGKTPVLEDYYSPGCQLALTRVAGNEWYAQCDYAGTSLAAGATHPNTDGIVFSLHYANWSNWNKTNDFSNPGTSSFVESNKLSILRADGSVLCNAGG